MEVTFKKDLELRKKQKLYRSLSFSDDEGSFNFSSNDYLGLRNHPSIRQALKQFLENDEAVSSSASPLLGGYSSYHKEALEFFCQWRSCQASLAFSSGYQASLGVLPALAKHSLVFSDELNHASLIDGIRLSGSPYHIFRHNDLNHLEDLLKKTKDNKSGQKLIVTESLFSMSGDFSHLESLSQLCDRYKALLYLDEAHSTGLFGDNLSGLSRLVKNQDFLVSLHTGGKALASPGAFVACSQLIQNHLINHCRSFIYSTAPSALFMRHWLAVLKLLKQQDQQKRAKKLRQKALQMRQALGLEPTESPILFINLKTTDQALKVSKELSAKKYFIPAIRYPTVPKDKQGLRIVLRYDHKDKEISALLDTLKSLL